MKGAFKGAAFFVAVTCMVWIAVLWRWRTTPRALAGGDLVLYLGLLPVALFAFSLAARWAVRSAFTTQKAAAERGTAAPTETLQTPDESAPVAWHLRDAWVHTAGGADVVALLRSIEAGAPRPCPDATLRDADGLPVMTARVADLETEAVDAALSGDGSAPLPARAVRALAILAPLLDELLESPALAAPSGADARVRVLAAWPADWDDATCAAALAWLTGRLGLPKAAPPPPVRWAIRAERIDASDLLADADRILDALRRDGRDDPLVLLACHSDLDDAGIRALEATQRLFHATRRPKVPMAGEGAAVLVVAASAVSSGDGPPAVRCASPILWRRDRSIDAPGRIACDDAIARTQLALDRAGLSAETVGQIVSDADQHTARATELFGVALALLPDLDADADLRLIAAVSGRLEAVAPLVTLACAAAQARASGRPALALSLADPHTRMAAVLVPDSCSAPALSARAGVPSSTRPNPR